MAELNDKLITYGNLSTFYDKLQEQGLGGNAIEEVSELPNASENKDKLFRLDNGEKDVYAAKLLSSTVLPPTNRLPDAQQIDKAYFYLSDDGSVYYYKGIYKIICSDGELIWNRWGEINDDEMVFATELSPNEGINNDTPIVCINDYGSNITETSAYFDGMSIDDVKADGTVGDLGFIIPATYNAPESAQIGNAYLIDGNDRTYVYNGSLEIRCSNGSKTVYYWNDGSYEINYTILTKVPASEIVADLDNDGAYCVTSIKYGDDSTFDAAYGEGEEFAYWEYDGTLAELENQLFTSYTIGSMISNDGGTLYIPQLNAPDSEQVDNAYISWTNSHTLKYKGDTLCTLIDEEHGTTYYGYKWQSDDTYYATFTNKKASDIYGDDLIIYDAPSFDEWVLVSGNTYTTERINVIDWVDYSADEISTVKYQRTVVTEEWGWQDIIPTYASDSDIDDLFAAPTPTGNKFYLLKASDDYGAVQNEAFVHTAGDTVDYNGQTCYRWYKQEDDAGTLSSDSYWDDMYMLTNTLNIHLPFNKYSAEFVAIISNDSPTSYLASFGKDDFVQMIVE